MANAGLRDEEKIKEGIKRADFIRKGTSLPHELVFERWGKYLRPVKQLTLYLQRSRPCESVHPSILPSATNHQTNPHRIEPSDRSSHLPMPLSAESTDCSAHIRRTRFLHSKCQRKGQKKRDPASKLPLYIR